MVDDQRRSKRKVSGARYKPDRGKRSYEASRLPSFTKLGSNKVRYIKGRSGIEKFRLLQENVANLYDPAKKQYSKVKIKTILENAANRHYVRRNIMTKGTVIDTEAGKARITNRPGQEGHINATLMM
ncbi:30S ribosomal protein S8e [Candidatus Woesearchaeota archaeon CG_4_10_14_0_8_um_filter_47_5]|nr:MAG: 30S ribosomal protein S8e [Candidatus Woesearchaeota archaeon CG_4_10_14_0_8_um_filter_47_5]